MTKRDYQVGYKKPPRATQFQKGTSGNPSGRPKKLTQLVELGDVVQTIDNEAIVVTDNGKHKRMSKAEIGFRMLFANAIKGDLAAARLLVRMAKKYFEPEPEEGYQTEFVSRTEAARRFGRSWPQRIDELNAALRRRA